MSQINTHNKYTALANECDQLIKAGKISTAANLVSRLNLAQVPRPSRQSLAKICRRVDMISQGLRLLQPIVRNEKKKIDPPTAGEICEYSVLLSRNGSVSEAANLLAEVDATKTPEAFLFLAYCHISNWDYGKAAPLLEKFLSSDADNYTKLIARVNLISSYLAVSQLDHAIDLLSETIPMAKTAGAARLIGNCLELQGRVHLYKGDFTRARADLNQALEIFSGSQIYDRLFINKWQAVMMAIENRSTQPLLHFRNEALAKKDWESVREADLFTIKVDFDQKLLDHLTFGTPMEAYRQRIKQEVGGTPSPSFLFGNVGLCLDLQTGTMNQSCDFNPGKKIHQVLAALVRDFYGPRNVGTLFSELYPEEYFDINSSPRRVRELLRRTRLWLSENKIPATIQHTNSTFRFLIHGAFGIQIPLDGLTIQTSTLQFEQLKSVFPAGVRFSAKEACEKLKWPRSSFLLVAERALKNGELQKSGKGKSTFYSVTALSRSRTSSSAA